MSIHIIYKTVKGLFYYECHRKFKENSQNLWYTSYGSNEFFSKSKEGKKEYLYRMWHILMWTDISHYIQLLFKRFFFWSDWVNFWRGECIWRELKETMLLWVSCFLRLTLWKLSIIKMHSNNLWYSSLENEKNLLLPLYPLAFFSPLPSMHIPEHIITLL